MSKKRTKGVFLEVLPTSQKFSQQIENNQGY
jgi:hypothetical protein